MGFALWVHNTCFQAFEDVFGTYSIRYWENGQLKLLQTPQGATRKFETAAEAESWVAQHLLPATVPDPAPTVSVRISDGHSANDIDIRTRWGGGGRNDPKTVALGDVNLSVDIADIMAGRATRLPNGDIRTPSGRTFGTHPGQTGISQEVVVQEPLI